MGFTQKTKLRDDHAPISFGKQKPQCHGDAWQATFAMCSP
jgi:hypothetical protein